jgi:hypothetical protein
MDDKDRVFARFKDDRPEPADRRETLSIPRRSGAGGSRVVEVVHIRSGGAMRERPQRVTAHVRAASWDGGFPAKRPVVAPIPTEPTNVEAVTPTAHVMPAWELPVAVVVKPPQPVATVVAPARGRGRPRKHAVREPAAAEVPAALAEEQIAVSRRGSGQPRKTIAGASARRIADPFDADDDLANCMRCGYAIEPEREKRGLMTCSECG